MSQRSIDQFTLLVMKHCGMEYTGVEPDPVSLINSCVEARAHHVALLYLDYLLANRKPTIPPVSIVPPRYMHSIDYICIIPQEMWAKLGMPVESGTIVYQAVVKFGENEQYLVNIPLQFAIVVGYRDERGERVYRSLVVRTGDNGTSAYIPDDSLHNQLLEICMEKKTQGYSLYERVITKEDIPGLIKRGHAVPYRPSEKRDK